MHESVEIVLIWGSNKGKAFKVGEANANHLISLKRAVLKKDLKPEMVKPKRGRKPKAEISE